MFARAFCAEPEMLDGVRVGRKFVGAMGFVKAEEFTLAIVKRNLADGIRACGKHRSHPPLVQSSFGRNHFCSDVNFRIAGHFRTSGLLETVHRNAEPVAKSGFEFFRCAVSVKRIEGVALFVQRNVTAGNFLAALRLGDDLHEDAFGTRPGRNRRIEIQASGRVLKDEVRTPSGSGGVTVAALLYELEFGFEDLKKIAIILAHKRLPPRQPAWLEMNWRTVTPVTG